MLCIKRRKPGAPSATSWTFQTVATSTTQRLFVVETCRLRSPQQGRAPHWHNASAANSSDSWRQFMRAGSKASEEFEESCFLDLWIRNSAGGSCTLRPTKSHRRSPQQTSTSDKESAMFGKVFLVGAGPGDPELLTLKALKALQSADVVLHDDLISAEILALTPKTAHVRSVGKRCGRKSIQQH